MAIPGLGSLTSGSVTDLVGRARAVGAVVQDATSLANAVLVQLQGVDYDILEQGATGKSLLFAYRGEDQLELQSDIPDHFSEKNEPMSDEIGLRPVQITLRGYVGELTNQIPGPLSITQAQINQLSALGPYQPQLTVQALEAFNVAQQLLQTAAAAAQTVVQAFDLAVGKDYENRQQAAFRYLFARWSARSLFTVLTPWTVLHDMAILSLRAIQDEDTQAISEFNVTFKQLRFASSELHADTISEGRRAAQSAATVSHGPQSPPSAGPINPTAVAGL